MELKIDQFGYFSWKRIEWPSRELNKEHMFEPWYAQRCEPRLTMTGTLLLYLEHERMIDLLWRPLDLAMHKSPSTRNSICLLAYILKLNPSFAWKIQHLSPYDVTRVLQAGSLLVFRGDKCWLSGLSWKHSLWTTGLYAMSNLVNAFPWCWKNLKNGPPL